MNSNIIWSGVVTSENVADAFEELCKILEGRTYTLSQKILKSSFKPKTHVDQQCEDICIEKMIGYSEISIQNSVGKVVLMQVPDLKEDTHFPFIEISTNQILINNLTPDNKQKTIVFVLNPY